MRTKYILERQETMINRGLLVTLTIIGWFTFILAASSLIVGLFFVLGTGQPWGLVVPVLFLSLGWVLTRLDLEEKYWKTTLGEILTTWGITGLLTSLLIISRTNSLSLALIGLPLTYFLGLAGVILLLWSYKTRKEMPPPTPLPPLPRLHD